MVPFYASRILSIVHSLSTVEAVLDHPFWATNFHANALLREVKELRQYLEELGLNVPAMAAIRFENMLENAINKAESEWQRANRFKRFFRIGREPKIESKSLAECAIVLRHSCHDNLLERFCFAIASDKVRLFKQDEPLFGERVAANFPSVTYDIEEAGKCLALGRSMAAVFHSIRCLEAAIRAFARCLDIPDPIRGAERTWSFVLNSIKGELDRRWPNAADRFRGDGHILEGIYGSLSGMRNPYRNSTMHLDAKYTDSEALHILELAKGLMRNVAERMDENGVPKA